MPNFRANNSLNSRVANKSKSVHNHSKLGEAAKKQSTQDGEAIKTLGNSLGRGCL